MKVLVTIGNDTLGLTNTFNCVWSKGGSEKHHCCRSQPMWSEKVRVVRARRNDSQHVRIQARLQPTIARVKTAALVLSQQLERNQQDGPATQEPTAQE